MGTNVMNSRRQAEKLMRGRRFARAIPLFEMHLRSRPEDVRALLELGICHLLNRSEREFLRIYGKARALLSRMTDLPSDVRRLWRQYRGLAVRVSAAALVMGAAALPGCSPEGGSRDADQSSSGVLNADEPDQNPTQAADVADVPADTEQQVTGPGEEPRPPRPVYSGHRYSAGVRPPLREKSPGE